jgi:chemotaxis protein histidine kinase CheA
VSRLIIEEMKGTLDISSKVGVGTRVELLIPINMDFIQDTSFTSVELEETVLASRSHFEMAMFDSARKRLRS